MSTDFRIGDRVSGPFGLGTITEITTAFGGRAYWVDFDDTDDSKLCVPSGLSLVERRL